LAETHQGANTVLKRVIEHSGMQQTAQSDRDVNAPWIVLDRFIRELEVNRQVPDRFASALATICDSTNARFAYVYTEAVGRATESYGSNSQSSQWCRQVTKGLVDECPRGGLWRGDDGRGLDIHIDRPPQSAVILPIDSSRSSWLVAVSFDSEHPLDESDFRIITVIWRLQARNNRNVRHYENLKETLFGTVRCLSAAIDAKDPYTSGHSERVARIAVRIGEEMCLSRGETNDLYLAGLLHDVGKIGIRDEVLFKPGPLTSEEFAHVREHPITGERIISNVTRLAYLRPAVRGHHERYNGGGYPDGLVGEAIPLAARILAVADSCDAMMSTRRYRLALAPTTIETIFAEGAGMQWDPAIVQFYFTCRDDLYAVCERGLGHSVYAAVERAAGGGSQNLVASLAMTLSAHA
jgi:HD-GYP domain-containing protein (c-di-GMP phosphodiesterase class II)